MVHKRSDHAVAYVPLFGHIYASGSYFNNEYSKTCERFDVANNTWKEVPEMIHERAGHSLCLLNEKYLFAIGGKNNESQHLTSIEVLDVSKLDVNGQGIAWKEINYIDKENSPWDGAYQCQSCQISEQEILIFGGRSSEKQEFSLPISYKLNVTNGDFEEGPPLANVCSYVNNMMCCEKMLYGYATDTQVYKYSIEGKEWIAVEKGGS
jgi:hypothetical protein